MKLSDLSYKSLSRRQKYLKLKKKAYKKFVETEHQLLSGTKVKTFFPENALKFFALFRNFFLSFNNCFEKWMFRTI